MGSSAQQENFLVESERNFIISPQDAERHLDINFKSII